MLELSLLPAGKNAYPLRGILIPGESPAHWLREIQRMGFSLEGLAVFPVPASTGPNRIWGCFVDAVFEKKMPEFDRNTPCQLVQDLIFIPEKTAIYPGFTKEEAQRILLGKRHVFHPEFDMAELPESVRWEDLIAPPVELQLAVREPAPSVFIPKQVKGFQLFAPTPEEVLEQLEERHFPKNEKLKEEPLDAYEKTKLAFYDIIFRSGMGNAMAGSAMLGNMQADYEELLRRNKKQIDRLIDMLKDDPQNALKYALPIDDKGFGRGSGWGEFRLSKRWSGFTLFNNPRNTGSGGRKMPVDENDLGRLRQQYRDMARKLLDQRDFQKAAFIYLKLLKDYPAAAQALEQGELFAEAASIYLKYVKNKHKAAECYEKARMTREAIELYKEIGQFEKAGDLCTSAGNTEEARRLYGIVIREHLKSKRYLKASLIFKDKMDDLNKAQGLLLQGWKENSDAFNCLDNYFANIKEDGLFLEKMRSIYNNDLDGQNWPPFLQVLRHGYRRRAGLEDAIREIAHEIIAEKRNFAPWVVSELPHFQPGDPLITKDIMRYSVNPKK